MNTKVCITVRFSSWGLGFFLLTVLQVSGGFAVTWGLLSVFFSRLDMTS